MALKILVFPKDSNPYQELLYKPLRNRAEIRYVDVSQQSLLRFISFGPLLFCKLVMARLQGFKLIHVHWIYPFYVPTGVPLRRQLTYIQVRGFFMLLRALRYRVVWTVHNVVPQVPQSINDEHLMRVLSRLSKAKIVHSSHVITDMKAHGLDTGGVQIIPHGSYVGVYPDTTTKAEARAQLGLAPDALVILFFGNISPYKGLDKLLKVMRDIHGSKVSLVIAGAGARPELREQIGQLAKNLPVIFHDGRVPESQVNVFFNASDVVCLPFSVITTSGSTILALSFGKPVIAPRIGALCDMPDNIGYFYNPNEPGALKAAIARAVADPAALGELGSNARHYAQGISWDKISEQTYRLYQEVAGFEAREKND